MKQVDNEFMNKLFDTNKRIVLCTNKGLAKLYKNNKSSFVPAVPEVIVQRVGTVTRNGIECNVYQVPSLPITNEDDCIMLYNNEDN